MAHLQDTMLVRATLILLTSVCLGTVKGATASRDVVLTVELWWQEYVDIVFSWDNFQQFLVCLCGTYHPFCVAQYDNQNGNQTTSVATNGTEIIGWEEDQKFYRCFVEFWHERYDKLVCQFQINGSSCTDDRLKFQAFRVSNSDCGSLCTELSWDYPSLNVAFHTDANVEFYSDSCECPPLPNTTAAVPTFSTTATTAAAVPTISSTTTTTAAAATSTTTAAVATTSTTIAAAATSSKTTAAASTTSTMTAAAATTSKTTAAAASTTIAAATTSTTTTATTSTTTTAATTSKTTAATTSTTTTAATTSSTTEAVPTFSTRTTTIEATTTTTLVVTTATKSATTQPPTTTTVTTTTTATSSAPPPTTTTVTTTTTSTTTTPPKPTTTTTTTETPTSVTIPIASSSTQTWLVSTTRGPISASQSKDDPPTGVIVGVVIAVIVLAVIIALVVYFVRRGKQRHYSPNQQTESSTSLANLNNVRSDSQSEVTDIKTVPNGGGPIVYVA